MVNININGNSLAEGYCGFSENLASSFIDCHLWKALGYDSSLEMGTDCTFMVRLRCKIFNPLASQFTILRGEKLVTMKRVNILEQMSIEIDYLTQEPQLSISELVQDLNYLFTSWLVNIEYKYPMAFSFYGRHFLQINYSTLNKTISAVFDPVVIEALEKMQRLEGQVTEKKEYDLHDILLTNIINMQDNEIMTEYNTLNILKELDNSPHRLKACKKFSFDYDDTSIPLKNRVYNLQVWKETKLSSYTWR